MSEGHLAERHTAKEFTPSLLRAPRCLIYIVCGFVGVSGCGKPDAGSAHNAPHKAEAANQNKDSKAEEAKTLELPGAVRGTGWHIPWYAPDPKHPDRPPQRVLVADAKEGAMESDNDVATVHLRDVQATLYHDGKPSATLVAPHVMTNERDRVIVATGGVVIHSLINPPNKRRRTTVPPNSTVTADKVVWNSRETKVVCTGHARLISKQPGSPDIESYSDKIIYDTETGDVDFLYNTR